MPPGTDTPTHSPEHEPEAARALTVRYPFTTTHVLIAAVGIAVLCVLFALIVSFSLTSLPGDALYGVKTGIAERAISLTKVSDTARLSYDIARMETRLHELQMLAEDSRTIKPDALSSVASLIDGHSKVATTRIDVSDMTLEERIDTLLRLATVIKAQETLAEQTDELKMLSDDVDGAKETADDALRKAVDAFARTENVDEFRAYVGTQIEAVALGLTSVAPGSDAARFATARAERALESLLAVGDLATALQDILRAREALSVDAYLWGSERGETGTPPVTDTPIPEGN